MNTPSNILVLEHKISFVWNIIIIGHIKFFFTDFLHKSLYHDVQMQVSWFLHLIWNSIKISVNCRQFRLFGWSYFAFLLPVITSSFSVLFMNFMYCSHTFNLCLFHCSCFFFKQLGDAWMHFIPLFLLSFLGFFLTPIW